MPKCVLVCVPWWGRIGAGPACPLEGFTKALWPCEVLSGSLGALAAWFREGDVCMAAVDGLTEESSADREGVLDATTERPMFERASEPVDRGCAVADRETLRVDEVL